MFKNPLNCEKNLNENIIKCWALDFKFVWDELWVWQVGWAAPLHGSNARQHSRLIQQNNQQTLHPAEILTIQNPQILFKL